MAKTVFISGSNRGIGKATAILFAEHGWNIIAHSRNRSDEFLDFIQQLSTEKSVSIIPIYFDMRNESEMKEQIKDVVSKNKIEINALVNNAGAIDIKLFMLAPIASIKENFEINLFSHMRLTQLLLKRMPKGSAIVNVSSMDAYEPQRGETAYASAKAAMLAWTEVLKKELLGTIRVNAVAPHSVKTDLALNIADKAVWKEDELISPNSVANCIYYLSSDESDAITGDVIKINGMHK